MHPNRILAALALTLAVPSSAVADGTGGISAPGRPSVSTASCSESRTAATCWRGAVLRIEGSSLQAVSRVRFLGRDGREDDRSMRPAVAQESELQVRVPSGVRSGPVVISSSLGSVRLATLSIVRPPTRRPAVSPLPVSGSDRALFPIRGEHDYGTATNTFGGGRGHQGQDVFARCGTPLVAALPGRVIQSTFHSRAGNYVVVQTVDSRSYAYMHMREPSALSRGDVVAAGDPIGEVGETGRASGCHLHFELWTAPGRYRGGRPIDPLPTLRAWDRDR